MNFRDSCEAIKTAFMLTDKEKSNLIAVARGGDPQLTPILEQWKASEYKNGETFYDALKSNNYIGGQPTTAQQAP
jgi:hypothetical protein